MCVLVSLPLALAVASHASLPHLTGIPTPTTQIIISLYLTAYSAPPSCLWWVASSTSVCKM